MQETQDTQVQSLCQEDPLEAAWQPTPVLLPGEFHGQRSLVGYSPWGHKDSDRTDRLTLSLFIHIIVSHIEVFHCLKNPLHPTYHLSLPDSCQPLIFFFNCLYSFTFSSMSCSWTHTVCSLFRLASFTSV